MKSCLWNHLGFYHETKCKYFKIHHILQMAALPSADFSTALSRSWTTFLGLCWKMPFTFLTNKKFWTQQPAHDIKLLNSHDSHETLPSLGTRCDFPPLTSLCIEYDNSYFVFIHCPTIISIHLMVQPAEPGTSVSIFIELCLLSNKKPEMRSFNHTAAQPRAWRILAPCHFSTVPRRKQG